DRRPAETRRPGPGAEYCRRPSGRLRGQVPGRRDPPRNRDARRPRRRRQRAVHRPPGPAPTGAMKPPSRTLTTLAVGFLALDALLLVYGGMVSHRRWLVVAGGLCVVAAITVVFAWRRYRHTLEELEIAGREMRQDVESIR